MLFQPAIIALLLASALSVLGLVASAPFAVEVIRRWDIRSGSERQLQLERRTYLFSTLLTFVLALQLAAVLLFVFNADKDPVISVVGDTRYDQVWQRSRESKTRQLIAPDILAGKKVLVIGAGIAGLSAASYLQRNGFDTEIFELHDKPGAG